jgi:hypothetical protein
MSGNGGQTTYDRSFSAPYAGTLGDNQAGKRIEDFLNSSANNIPFGIGLQGDGSSTPPTGDQGLPNRKAKEFQTGGGVVLGVSMKSEARDPGSAATTLGAGTQAVFAGHEFNLLVEGAIWVTLDTDAGTATIAPDTDKVYCRQTANGAGKLQLGAFRKDTDGGNADKVKGARWLTGVLTTKGGAKVAQLYFSSAAEFASLA